MSGVIRDIVDAYEGLAGKGGKGVKGHRPEVMVMNLVTPGEALAVSTLGADHVSLSGKVMEELAGGRNEGTFMPEVLNEHEAILQPMELDEEMGSKKAKGKGKEKGEHFHSPLEFGSQLIRQSRWRPSQIQTGWRMTERLWTKLYGATRMSAGSWSMP
jgi:hypothetical protein